MIDPMKMLLIDALCGVGIPGMILGQKCEEAGLAKYTGDQHDMRWEWDRQVLVGVAIEQLQELYQAMCEQREKNFVPTEPLEEPGLILLN